MHKIEYKEYYREKVNNILYTRGIKEIIRVLDYRKILVIN